MQKVPIITFITRVRVNGLRIILFHKPGMPLLLIFLEFQKYQPLILNYLDYSFCYDDVLTAKSHDVKTYNVHKVIHKCGVICLQLWACSYAECGFFITLHVQKFTLCFVVLT